MNIIQQFEAEEISRLSGARAVPEFGAGGTVRVSVKVVEGDRSAPRRSRAFASLGPTRA